MKSYVKSLSASSVKSDKQQSCLAMQAKQICYVIPSLAMTVDYENYYPTQDCRYKQARVLVGSSSRNSDLQTTLLSKLVNDCQTMKYELENV